MRGLPLRRASQRRGAGGDPGAGSAGGPEVTFRGAGRSYGDAALNSDGLVVDATRLTGDAWESESGVLEAEPGLTIEGLWRRTLEDGYWPAVVPGTMRPTLGGCVAMNVHGKNNFRVGTFGEHVVEFDLLTARRRAAAVQPRRRTRTCSTRRSAGSGLLGAITRVKLRLKRVESGLPAGRARWRPHSSARCSTTSRSACPTSDYLVGWVDCFAAARSSGAARSTRRALPGGPARTRRAARRCTSSGRAAAAHPRRAAEPALALHAAVHQRPRHAASSTWRSTDRRARTHGKTYLQSHVAFAFLLDYVPNWRLPTARGGFIQYQVFVPAREARTVLCATCCVCQRRAVGPRTSACSSAIARTPSC